MSAPDPIEISGSARRRREQQRSHAFFILFAGLFVFAAIAAALYFALRPETLRIAVGPPGSDDQKLVQLLAQTFTRQHNSIRLAPISTEGAVPEVAENGVAVEVGRIVVEGEYSGHESSGEYRYTTVWIKIQKRWRMLANQITLIAK